MDYRSAMCESGSHYIHSHHMGHAGQVGLVPAEGIDVEVKNLHNNEKESVADTVCLSAHH